MTEEYVKQVGALRVSVGLADGEHAQPQTDIGKAARAGPDGGHSASGAGESVVDAARLHRTRRTIGGLPESGCGVRIWSFSSYWSKSLGGLSAGFRRAILGLSSCGSTYGFIRANREDVWHEAGILYACRAGLERCDSRRDNRNVSRKDESWSCDTARVPRRHCRRPRGHPTRFLSHILMYPLSKFTGQQQTKDWGAVPKFPSTAQGEEEVKWVEPIPFFDELGTVLKEVPPLPGEEAIYQTVQSVLDAAKKDPKLHAALVQSAVEADKTLIAPLFQFHNSGLPLANNWTTINNGAAFGTDYYTRAAAAKWSTSSLTRAGRRSISTRKRIAAVRR